jgi:hypothetical protein
MIPRKPGRARDRPVARAGRPGQGHGDIIPRGVSYQRPQHELLLGLGQYCVDAGLIFCQAGTLGRVGLPLALSLHLAQGILSRSSQQSLIFGVSVPRCLPDSPDEVLKLTSRYLDPDPSVWVDPHLALSPDETHPMTELPEPGVLARAVLPRVRRTAVDSDLQPDMSLIGLVDGVDPGDRAGIAPEGIRIIDHAVPSVAPVRKRHPGRGFRQLERRRVDRGMPGAS